MVWDTHSATRLSTSGARLSVPRMNSRERCRDLECGRTQKQFHVIAWPSNLINAWRDSSRRLPGINKHMSSRAEPIEENQERMPVQMPASRVSRIPGGNNRQERKDAVWSLQDGKRRADNAWATTWQRKRESRREAIPSREPECVSRVGACENMMAMVPHQHLRSPGKGKSLSEGREYVNWIPTGENLKNVFVAEWKIVGCDSSVE